MRLICTFLILVVYEIEQNVLVPGMNKLKITDLINFQYIFNLTSSLTVEICAGFLYLH
ncbi:protein of unknown function [Oenococcus oeni]|uniref:Uncharacterized protein n=1 Tax=Oenococcus oeni TaxID=1247 RepID=A0AAQ2UT39_OENOE|nr:hypothetical protein OENI_160029 [Oenococcus oeni]VDB98774.1 protein of unknown function [Oenococcus oeni]